MAVNGSPFHALFRVFCIINIDFGEEFVQLMFDHSIEGKGVWLPFLPCVYIDTKDHQNRRCQQDRREIIDDQGVVNGRKCKQSDSNKGDESR